MDKRRLVILVLVLLLAGCEEGTSTARRPYAIELEAQADALERQAQAVALQETAQAQATREAQDVAMRATTDALNAQAQATAQVLDTQATQQALSFTATRQAMARETAQTAEARNDEALATAASVTATVQAVAVAVESTAQAAEAISAEATAQAVQRKTEREQVTQPLLTFGPWALLLVALVGLAVLLVKGLPIVWRLVEDRARLVRRRPNEGEPVMIVTRERLALPMRSFGPYTDLTHGQERMPLLAPTVETQEATTMRQQTANLVRAQQVGRVAEAESKSGPASRVVRLPRSAARREYHDPHLPPIHIREAQELRPLIEDVRRQIEEGTIEGELC